MVKLSCRLSDEHLLQTAFLTCQINRLFRREPEKEQMLRRPRRSAASALRLKVRTSPRESLQALVRFAQPLPLLSSGRRAS
ncbi:hypothetical protein [Polaromonas sp. YR568]|uniref:hypothetical protein n=1 Tax=Polaromonas sp. YR568 TaxID=1855301 RepID=UPI00313812A1